MNRKEFYKTQKWRDAREAYMKAVGGLCERCLACGIIKPGRFVHHKIHLTDDNFNDPALALSFDNLELLCVDCHAAEHDSHRYVIDANGNCITKAGPPVKNGENARAGTVWVSQFSFFRALETRRHERARHERR